MKQTAKPVQLLQLLLSAGDAGVSRRRILDSLFVGESESDATNSLNVAASRLRKLLRDSDLPECNLISVRFDRYFFDAPFPVWVDTEEVERLRQAADIASASERISILYNMCDLYYGRFLPDLDGEDWVEILRAHYQRIFHVSLQELFIMLAEKKALGEIQRLVDFANSVFPLEDWISEYIPIINAKDNDPTLSITELKRRVQQGPVFLREGEGNELVVLKREDYDELIQ